MTVDVIVVVVLVIMAALGWRSGALSQVIRIAAAVLAVLGAVWAAGPLRDVIFGPGAELTTARELGSIILAGVLIYAVIAITGWLITKAVHAASENLSKLDRAGGAAMGTLKALVLIYFILSIVVLLKVPMEKLDPSNAMHLRGGVLTTFIEQHNVLAPWSVPNLDRLHDALKVRYYADELDRERVLHVHPNAVELLRKDRVAELARDRALMQAVLDDGYAYTLSDPRVRALLDDDEFVSRLIEVDWASLVSEVQSPVHAS
ncbi:MAG: CvpA family protein [Myxococcota bacterium]